MIGRRMALIFLLTGSLVVSACSMSASPVGPTDGDDPAVPCETGLEPTSSSGFTEQPVEYKQEIESLPDKKTLTYFPGVLESMSLTLEQLIKVLGTSFDLQENKALCLDTYSFPQYGLAFDFDSINKEITTIWLNEKPYYVNSGFFKIQDFNYDGIADKIAAYEDEQYNGHILIINGASLKFSDKELAFFGGRCDIEILPQFGTGKENLLLVKTLGGDNGDVLEWKKDGELSSILPADYSELSGRILVTVEADKAVMVNKDRDLLYVCPLSGRLAKNLKNQSSAGAHRLDITLSCEKSGDSILLKVRTSLQVRLTSSYNFIDSTDGTYCDVAQVTQKYKYLGRGEWQEESIDGSAKYEGSSPDIDISLADLSMAGLTLYDDYQITKGLLDISSFNSLELSEGVIAEKDGLCVGITRKKVSYLSVETGSQKATSKGLKPGDAREKALSLYGIPDKGYVEDSHWTYYVLSEEKSEYNSSVLVNTLNIEFEDEKVCRIWISAYVTAY